MKRIIVLRSALCLLLVTVLLLFVTSGTFARYTQSQSASAQVGVVKWAFNVNDKNLVTQNFTFNLFDGIISEGKDAVDQTSSGADTDLQNASLIAPGTHGKYTFKLENKSNLPSACVLTFNINVGETSSKKAMLEFSTDNTTWVSTFPASFTTNTIAANGSKNFTIYWRWRKDGDISADDVLKDTSTTITVSATAEAYQVQG